MDKVCMAQKGEGVGGGRRKEPKGPALPTRPLPLPTNPLPLSTPTRRASDIYTFLKIPVLLLCMIGKDLHVDFDIFWDCFSKGNVLGKNECLNIISKLWLLLFFLVQGWYRKEKKRWRFSWQIKEEKKWTKWNYDQNWILYIHWNSYSCTWKAGQLMSRKKMVEIIQTLQ